MALSPSCFYYGSNCILGTAVFDCYDTYYTAAVQNKHSTLAGDQRLLLQNDQERGREGAEEGSMEMVEILTMN